MEIAKSRTKYKLIISIIGASMFFVAAEVGVLAKNNPQNAYEAGCYFGVISLIFISLSIYYYIKASKEDKLSEGL